MLNKIIVLVLVVLVGWAISANFAVFRYYRATNGTLERRKGIAVAQMVTLILAGIIGAAALYKLFSNQLATFYTQLCHINPQAFFIGEILAAVTAIIFGASVILIGDIVCEALAQTSNFYLLRVIDAPESQALYADGDIPALPVYGDIEPTLAEYAQHGNATGPHFSMKAADLVAAMKDAGWKLQRDPELRTSTPQ